VSKPDRHRWASSRFAAICALGLLALGAGCTKLRSSFICSSDASCVSQGQQGRCEPVGYCSFPDPGCPLGRRFGAWAEAGLAGTCVTTASTMGDGGSGTGCVAQVFAGGSHACARMTDGTLRCWGNNFAGELGDSTLNNAPVPVEVMTAVGGPPLAGVLDVTAGQAHTCALTNDGSVWCWGYNNYGQLGNGDTMVGQLSVPLQIIGPGKAATIVAGTSHTCVLNKDATMACWGRNDSGQLGNNIVGPGNCGATAGSSTAATVLSGCGGMPFSSVVAPYAGESHTCTRVTDGTLWCWGDNGSGQLGHGPGAGTFTPTEVLSAVSAPPFMGAVDLALGGAHTCARKGDNSLFCWGANASGQLGNGTINGSATPVAALVSPGGAPFTDVVEVAAGQNHTCARKSDNSVWCWGSNVSGQLGDGTMTNRFNPVPVLASVGGMPVSDIVELSAGIDFTCARRMDGVVLCWGSNQYGQLGDGTTMNRINPVPVSLSCP
jgi:alpha-tubulin suppressor-like RCC1 family protein